MSHPSETVDARPLIDRASQLYPAARFARCVKPVVDRVSAALLPILMSPFVLGVVVTLRPASSLL